VVTESDIEEKIIMYFQNTINHNKYLFDDNIEDSIYKTALLIGKSEYRNPQLCKSEAINIREEYSALTHLDALLKHGMGKETLKLLLGYLLTKGINVSKKEIIAEIDFIPSEINAIFEKLLSNEAINPPDNLPEVQESTEENLEDVSQESMQISMGFDINN
jgi:hypothetical protein